MGGYYTSSPMIISHRGLTKNVPENTLESYQEAIMSGFKGVEMDIISSKDGIIYCSHNHDLERETKFSGYIHEMNSVEIDKVKTGNYSHPKNQKKLPRFEKVIKNINKNIRLNIEIKFSNPLDFSTIRILRDLVLNKKIKQPILISSFNPFIVFFARWFIPNVKVGFLVETINMIKWVHFAHPHCIHPRADLLNNKLINKCKKKNISINVWTVNSDPVISHFKKLGVQGIITDRGDYNNFNKI